ncbi:MAG: hypothetical protein ACJAWH_000723 [Maribacter sp.]|jgi:hypothetical protein
MASLLKRQLKKYLPEGLSGNKELKPFLPALASSCASYKEKLSMMQPATTISSEEIFVAYGELMVEADKQKQVENSLKHAVDSLNVNQGIIDNPEHSNNLNIGVEKLAGHVTLLSSRISSVTEERNFILKDLEAKNEALNNYVQMVSHDLKSTIRNISVLIFWIVEEEKNRFSAYSRQNCSLVSENFLRIDNLINVIL